MVIVIGEMTIVKDRLSEFLLEVERMEEVTRKEDGCISYAMALDDESQGKISIAERWRDENALRVHLATDSVRQFVERCGPMIISMDGKLYDAMNERNVM